MKRKLRIVLVGLTVSAGMTWAGTLDTNPADFPTTINWCQFTGACPGAGSFPTPTAWVSSGSDTGWVGLNATGQNFETRQQGSTWNGNFASGMGLVYNGGSDGSGHTPTDVVLLFNQAEYGAGAYVESGEYGAFTATITLYDSSDAVIDSFVEAGDSENDPGTAIFIGAYDPTADVWAVGFNILNADQVDDVGIGTAGLMDSPPATTPEPASVLLIAPALLGLAAFGRKRILNSQSGNH